jgi:heat shock protein HslJ
LSRVNAWVDFSAGGFLNHGAGCFGSYPAFYRLSGAQVTVTRLERVETGKCPGDTAAERTAAAKSERLFASFLDRLAGWSRQGDVLTLTARDGTRATLRRPVDPNPELRGRWLIESIGGKPLATDRPATLEFRRGFIGAYADCNRISAQFTTPSPGRISVSERVLATERGCIPDDEAEDRLMVRAIKGAAAYRLAGDRLIFTGGPGMVLRRPPAPDRRLAGEYESCGSTMLGAYHQGPVTLTISESGMRDNAGCSATYVANGPDLDVRLADTPACKATAPPYAAGQAVGVGGDISVLSVWRPDGFGFNDEGQLILRTKRSHMTMCRKGAPRPFGS